MQGYVLAFRPATRDGTIVTDAGEAIRFTSSAGHADLHGGDVVTFEVNLGETRARNDEVQDIEVVRRLPETLKASQRPLLKEWLSTLRVEQPVH